MKRTPFVILAMLAIALLLGLNIPQTAVAPPCSPWPDCKVSGGGGKKASTIDVDFSGLIETDLIPNFEGGIPVFIDLTFVEGLTHDNFMCEGTTQLDEVVWNTDRDLLIRPKGDIWAYFRIIVECPEGEDRHRIILRFSDGNPEIVGNTKTYSSENARVDFFHFTYESGGSPKGDHSEQGYRTAFGTQTIAVTEN